MASIPVRPSAISILGIRGGIEHTKGAFDGQVTGSCEQRLVGLVGREKLANNDAWLARSCRSDGGAERGGGWREEKKV